MRRRLDGAVARESSINSPLGTHQSSTGRLRDLGRLVVVKLQKPRCQCQMNREESNMRTILSTERDDADAIGFPMPAKNSTATAADCKCMPLSVEALNPPRMRNPYSKSLTDLGLFARQ